MENNYMENYDGQCLLIAVNELSTLYKLTTNFLKQREKII